MLFKCCTRCNRLLPGSMFYTDNGSADKLTYRCRDCFREYAQAAKSNPDVRARKRQYQRVRYYGTDVAGLDYTRCAACRCAVSETGSSQSERPHIDHCHRTGKVREVLCRGCNLALGNVNDSTERLQQLLTYLHKHQEL